MSDEKPGRKNGRPSRNWLDLYREWVASGMPKIEFLISKGVDPTSGNTRERTNGWERSLIDARDKIVDGMTAQAVANDTRAKIAIVQATDGIKPDDLQKGSDPPPAAANPESSWAMIQRWRGNQSQQDWKLCDQIRMHIALILKRGLKKDAVTGEWASTLRASEVRFLALATSDIQRVQRLALGLSTENIGVDGPITVDAIKTEVDAPKNLFVVELTKGGKFTRARPRQVK